MTGVGVPGESRYAVLRTIVCRGRATPEIVAGATGLDSDTVRATLDDLEASGSVVWSDDQVVPTDMAEKEVRGYADVNYGPVRENPAVERWMERFETQNGRFLETMAAWRQRDVDGTKVANDHSDPGYDDQVIARVDATLARMGKLIDELATKIPRLARYGERFEEAFERVDDGDERFLCDPAVDSVQEIWSELHDDVLVIMGKERAG